MVIPSSALRTLTLLGITWLSEHYDERTIFAMVQNIWTLPCLIALRFWPGQMTDVWGTYALVVVTLSYPATRAIAIGWLSKNSNTVSTRTVSIALYNGMFTQSLSLLLFISTVKFFMLGLFNAAPGLTYGHATVFVEVGYAYSNNIYVEEDKPLYRRGNTNLIIINVVSIGVFLLTKLYYVVRNRQRDRVWAGMDAQQRHDYAHYSRDTGSKRLDFRFAH